MSLKRIILASASPRRRQLLLEAGYDIEVQPAYIDEGGFDLLDVPAADHAKRLALAKAMTVARRFPRSIVLGADTVVDCQGDIIGKAADAVEAEEITRRLFSTVHEVVTGLALVRLKDGLILVDCDRTRIFPRPMTEDQIFDHIASGTWRDKAGAYAIQEGGDEFVEKIEGSFTNVIGLPMELLEKLMGGITDIAAKAENAE